MELLPENWKIHVLSSMFFSGHDVYKLGAKLNKRKVYNFELEYITESSGGMYINEVYYPVTQGDIILRKPGDTTQGVMPYACYLIVFGTTRETYINRGIYVKHDSHVEEKSEVGGFINELQQVYHSDVKEQLVNVFSKIEESYKQPEALDEYRRRLWLEQILLELYDTQCVGQNMLTTPSPYSVKIDRVKAYMKAHLSEKIYLEQIAKVSKLSLFHFNRVFTEQEGLTPIHFLNRLRIEQGQSLLINTKESITSIGSQCGFETSSYFSQVFKKYVGLSPKEYRKQYSYDI